MLKTGSFRTIFMENEKILRQCGGATVSSGAIVPAVRPKGDEPHSILPLYIAWSEMMGIAVMAVHVNLLEMDMMTFDMDLLDCAGNLPQDIISLLRTSFNPKWMIASPRNRWNVSTLVIYSFCTWLGSVDESSYAACHQEKGNKFRFKVSKSGTWG